MSGCCIHTSLLLTLLGSSGLGSRSSSGALGSTILDQWAATSGLSRSRSKGSGGATGGSAGLSRAGT